MVLCRSIQPIPESIIPLKKDTIMVFHFNASINLLFYIQGSILLTFFSYSRSYIIHPYKGTILGLPILHFHSSFIHAHTW